MKDKDYDMSEFEKIKKYLGENQTLFEWAVKNIKQYRIVKEDYMSVVVKKTVMKKTRYTALILKAYRLSALLLKLDKLDKVFLRIPHSKRVRLSISSFLD